MEFSDRNVALEFAKRTRKNLLFIEQSRQDGCDVHEVTQLINSMLGLIVFPREEHFENKIMQLKLDDLVKQGWPRINSTKGKAKCKTLGNLLRLLRNSMAHYNLKFSSDSRDGELVAITVKNFPYEGGKTSDVPDWIAEIPISDLRIFCFKFIDLLDAELG